VKPELAVHSSGEIELAKRKLIDTGILKKPYNWLLLYGLPFNVGRSLLSGTWVSNAQDMAKHMFLMVDQIRQIDPTSVISVCAAGRAGPVHDHAGDDDGAAHPGRAPKTPLEASEQ
jgi:hypothetical protein